MTIAALVRRHQQSSTAARIGSRRRASGRTWPATFVSAGGVTSILATPARRFDSILKASSDGCLHIVCRPLSRPKRLPEGEKGDNGANRSNGHIPCTSGLANVFSTHWQQFRSSILRKACTVSTATRQREQRAALLPSDSWSAKKTSSIARGRAISRRRWQYKTSIPDTARLPRRYGAGASGRDCEMAGSNLRPVE